MGTAGIRLKLQERRRSLMSWRAAEEQGVDEVRQGLSSSELEEAAQANADERSLESLSDSQRREVQLIDAALARIDAGTYGVCISCGGNIARGRLTALPFAVRCAECEEESGRGRGSPLS